VVPASIPIVGGKTIVGGVDLHELVKQGIGDAASASGLNALLAAGASATALAAAAAALEKTAGVGTFPECGELCSGCLDKYLLPAVPEGLLPTGLAERLALLAAANSLRVRKGKRSELQLGGEAPVPLAPGAAAGDAGLPPRPPAASLAELTMEEFLELRAWDESANAVAAAEAAAEAEEEAGTHARLALGLGVGGGVLLLGAVAAYCRRRRRQQQSKTSGAGGGCPCMPYSVRLSLHTSDPSKDWLKPRAIPAPQPARSPTTFSPAQGQQAGPAGGTQLATNALFATAMARKDMEGGVAAV
jgi:hypothetical protein